jgi:asparagine synthase (glutamine-hydrolysing)
MLDAVRHRGSDDAGIHIDGELGFGCCRLSIIDPEGGHQPISNERGTVTVICNGEIYNHVEERRRLESLGHCFASRSDVEVIVHLYEELGDRCVDRLWELVTQVLETSGMLTE